MKTLGATKLSFFAFGLFALLLALSYFFASVHSKTVYQAITPERHLTTTTIGVTPAELLLSTSVQVEEIASTTASIPPIATTYIYTGAAEFNFNQQMVGLLSHVHWLIDQASIGGSASVVRTSTDRGFLDRQIERTADNANDSINNTRSELSADISEINERLHLAESALSSLSIAAASTSVMAANLTLNGYWLSGDGDDEGVFVNSAGNVGVGTSTPTSRLSIAGDMYLAGALRDGLNAPGTIGMVLQSTGTSTRWAATSTLGFTGGGDSLFTDGGATTYLTATGDNLAIGTTTAGSRLTVEGDLRISGGINFGAETIISRVNDNLMLGSLAMLNAGNLDVYTNISIGDFAGHTLTSGWNNIFIGRDAGQLIATGSRSVIIGNEAVGNGYGTVSDGEMVVIGDRAGYNMQSGGGRGVFLGFRAGENVTTGTGNTLLGYRAGNNITTGYGNIVIGYNLEAQSISQFETLNIGNLIFGTGVDGSGTTLSSGNIGIGTTTPGSKLTVAGDFYLTGVFRDSANNAGTAGMVLQTTGSGTQWVATSTLGFAASGATSFLGLTDTPGSFTANRVLFTNGSAVTDSPDFTFNGADLSVGNNGRFILNDNEISFNPGSSTITIGRDASFGGTGSGNENLGIGSFVFQNITTGNTNVAIGVGSAGPGRSITTGFGNVLIGNSFTGTSLSSGRGNTMLGSRNAYGLTTGDDNSLFGNDAGHELTGANSRSSFFGSGAGYRATSSANSVLMGFNTGYGGALYSAQQLTLVGTQAGTSILTGADNSTFFGYRAGASVTTGANNLLLGYQAADNLTTGSSNIVIGYDVDIASTTGSNQLNIGNLIFGTGVDGSGTTLSSGNIGIGTTTPGSKLTVAGDFYFTGALRDSTNNAGTVGMVLQTTGSGTEWVATSSLGISGGGSLFTDVGATTYLTATGDNLSIGTTTATTRLTVDGSMNVTGNIDLLSTSGSAAGVITMAGQRFIHGYSIDNTPGENLFVGYQSGNFTLGSTTQPFAGVSNIGVGRNTLSSLTEGSNNVAMGLDAMSNTTTGGSNTAVGWQAMAYNTTGGGNSAFGRSVLFVNTTGLFNSAFGNSAMEQNTEGSNNVAMGAFALQNNIDGNNNVAIGNGAGNAVNGWGNIFLGRSAGDNLTSGDNNIIIGSEIDAVSTTGSNRLNIGNLIFGTGVDGTGTTLSSGNIGIGTTNPGGKFEVVGDIISKGTEWTLRSSIGSKEWISVTYGNGLYVAVSADVDIASVMTSPDGINWTQRSSAAANTWKSVTYGNGLFVAVSNDIVSDGVMTSPDGINWTLRTSAAASTWNSVTYGNGLFVAVSGIGVGNGVMTSPDGINWTLRTSAAANAWNSVTYGNGLFVAVASTGTGNRVMTSPNGVTWTIQTSAADNNWNSVTYGNGLFVAVASTGTGNRVMTSPNGVTWTIQTSAADNHWNSVTYGNGLYVAVSNSGTIMTSPNGVTWTSRTSPTTDFWNSVTYGNGLFVAVASFSDFVVTSGKSEISVLAHNNLYQGGMNIMGNVGIGTTTPSEKLTVVGTIQSSDLFGGTTNLVTDANGNIIRETSDARLKENVTTLEGALDTVLALRGVRYKWIDKERFGDNFEIGFLAQEVDEVVPEVVQKGGDYWALNSKNLVAVVVEAIKEVWAKVLGHEERLVKLEAENELLKNRLKSIERELDIETVPDASTPPPVEEEETEDVDIEEISEVIEGPVEEEGVNSEDEEVDLEVEPVEEMEEPEPEIMPEEAADDVSAEEGG
jgi:hypothetical protein